MGYFEILDRIKPKDMTGSVQHDELTTDFPHDLPPHERQESSALVVDGPHSTVITVPVATSALDPGLDGEDFLTRIRGRLVGAEQANRNGQFWTTGDLVFGVGSVAGGPLNWLHEDRRIVGALTEARLVEPGRNPTGHLAAQHAAGEGWVLPHIEAASVMWSYLYPGETRIVREAAAQKKLAYSMECISRQVQCVGPTGCGATMPYKDAHLRTEVACEHIRARASARRFINPVFQGAALIVPPVTPGWSNANADLVHRAGASEKAMAFTDGDEAMAAQILMFVQGLAPGGHR